MLKLFSTFFQSLHVGLPSRREAEEAYLAQATDIYDLEQRMRKLDTLGHWPGGNHVWH